MIIEPPPFSSIEEAKAFLKNHEIATNNRYVINMTRKFSAAGLSTMKFPATSIRWDNPATKGKEYDGIPYVIVGVRTYHCQYGTNYKLSKQRDKVEEMFKPKKTRKNTNSKKVNCPAQAKMTLIVKFPGYAVKKYEERKAMRAKLVREFDDIPQRFVQVFLKIQNEHHHVTESLLLNNTPSRITQTHIESMSAIVLKPGATLRGKSLSAVNTHFALIQEFPDRLAQPTYERSLGVMTLEELLALFWDVTGVAPDKVFMETGKKFNIDNMRLLIHLCIVFANAEFESDGNVVAHRSVRIVGTENDIELITCFDTNCVIEDPHIHCPLCPRHKVFRDTEYFKTHYVKSHICSAIECVGLKILRCHDECIMKGCTKDIKAYKVGHWHCWKCDSGYEKRPQLLQHFKLHLQDLEKGYITRNSVLLSKSLYPGTDSDVVSFDLNVNTSNMNIVCHQKTTPKVKKKNVPRKKNSDDYDDDDDDEDDYDYDADDSMMYVHNDDGVTKSSKTTTQNDYEQPVVYVQDHNEPVVYGQSRENGEVVVKIHDENAGAYLNDRFTEIQKRCAELERINTKQKSQIDTLNKKIEKLESKVGINGVICSKCFGTVDKDNHLNDKQRNLLKSLKDLRTSHTYHAKKMEIGNEHLSVVVDGLHDIYKEIKMLKDITGISKKRFEVFTIKPKSSKMTSFESTNMSFEANDVTPKHIGTIPGNDDLISETFIENIHDDDKSTKSKTTSKKIKDETDYQGIEINDVSMFGKTTEVKRKRKVVNFPLPDSAMEILQKCVDKSGNSDQQELDIVGGKRRRTTRKKVVSCTSVVDNGKVTQADFGNDNQIMFDSTGEQYIQMDQQEDDSDHPYIQIEQQDGSDISQLPVTCVNSENGLEYTVYTTADISNSTITILPSNEITDNNYVTTSDNIPVTITQVTDDVPIYTATKLDTSASGGNRMSENVVSSSNIVTANQNNEEMPIHIYNDTTLVETVNIGNNDNPYSTAGVSISKGSTQKFPKSAGSQGLTQKSPKSASLQRVVNISKKHDDRSVPVHSVANVNESVIVQNNELTVSPSSNKVVGTNEMSTRSKLKKLKPVKRLNQGTSSSLVDTVSLRPAGDERLKGEISETYGGIPLEIIPYTSSETSKCGSSKPDSALKSTASGSKRPSGPIVLDMVKVNPSVIDDIKTHGSISVHTVKSETGALEIHKFDGTTLIKTEKV